MNIVRIFVLLCCVSLPMANAFGQVLSKPGNGQSPIIEPARRILPCNGDLILEENFDSGIPVGWSILDLDDLSPNSALGLNKGWQARTDYKDPANELVVSPSWYSPIGQSNDWLITPQITLGTNTCLSWVSYSQDRFFPETFEVRISTTTPDTNGFFAEVLVDSVGAEDDDYEYRAVNLSAWAGQSVYIAFRQTSNDKFVLALDEVKLANTGTVDAGISAWENTGSGNLADTIVIAGEIANYGSDTLRSVVVNFSVDGGPVKSMNYDSIKVLPFQTLAFEHDSLIFTDSTDRFYNICVWTSLPNGGTDSRLSNDTLCQKVSVGSPIAIDNPMESLGLSIFPNPSSGMIRIRQASESVYALTFSVLDLSGKVVATMEQDGMAGTWSWDLSHLPKGLYLLQLRSAQGVAGYKKIIIQ